MRRGNSSLDDFEARPWCDMKAEEIMSTSLTCYNSITIHTDIIMLSAKKLSRKWGIQTVAKNMRPQLAKFQRKRRWDEKEQMREEGGAVIDRIGAATALILRRCPALEKLSQGKFACSSFPLITQAREAWRGEALTSISWWLVALQFVIRRMPKACRSDRPLTGTTETFSKTH